MKTSETVSELTKAWLSARKQMGAVTMSGRNTFDNYDYSTLLDYLNTVNTQLMKHDLSLTASVESVETLDSRTTKKGGTEYAVRVFLVMRLTHVSGEWMEVGIVGEGQDRADKAVYKAITGARKYGHAQMFNLATGDDPEADETVGQSDASLATVTQEQANEIKELIQSKGADEAGFLDWAKIARIEDLPANYYQPVVQKLRKLNGTTTDANREVQTGQS